MKAILALDQGTTSSRALLFDSEGSLLAQVNREFRQHYPQPGWVEHDPLEIWNSQKEVAQLAIAQSGMAVEDIAAIGIANQRETTLVWDRRTGEPIHPAIVWQDRRTAEYCDSIRHEMGARVLEKTGLVIDSYFSASKLRWILENVPGARSRAEKGELAFGNVDAWLLWNLTHGACHMTDCANASRTMLYNLRDGEWDEELLAFFHIPRGILPEVRSNSEVYALAASEIFGRPIPVGGMIGDQQSALFGQNCLSPGMVKTTYGTGCFILMNIGSQPHPSTHQLLTTVAWKYAGNRSFAIEGSVFMGGAVVQWLRDGLGIIRSSSEVEALASQESDSGGVMLVPAFVGLGAPHWNQFARGSILGMTRGTNRAHIARAALEGIAFQVADVLQVMQLDAKTPLQGLRVDGGASANNLLMQFQADLLQAPVIRPAVTETTALGAAYMAGLAVGFWKDSSDICEAWKAERIFEPRMSADQAASRRARWDEAIKRSLDWDRQPTEAK